MGRTVLLPEPRRLHVGGEPGVWARFRCAWCVRRRVTGPPTDVSHSLLCSCMHSFLHSFIQQTCTEITSTPGSALSITRINTWDHPPWEPRRENEWGCDSGGGDS